MLFRSLFFSQLFLSFFTYSSLSSLVFLSFSNSSFLMNLHLSFIFFLFLYFQHFTFFFFNFLSHFLVFSFFFWTSKKFHFLFRALAWKSRLGNGFIVFFSFYGGTYLFNKSSIHFIVIIMHPLPLDNHQFPRIYNISR